MARRSSLYDWHAANGARFLEFGGWDIPEAYGKVEVEYAALRNGAGLVDLCHEARYRVEGDDAEAFLNELVTINMRNVTKGNSQSAYLCNQRGGILDEVIIYRDENYILLLGNGASRAEVAPWLDENAARFVAEKKRVTVADVSTAQGQIGLRGPGALPLLERVSFGQRFQMEPGTATLATIGTARSLVIKRHAISEGFDLIAGSVFIQPIWEKLIDAARATGARPVGFGALEVVRVESCIPRVGMEIDVDTTPLEIHKGDRVDFGKGNFLGRRALMHSTSNEFSRALVQMKFEGDVPVEAGTDLFFDSLPIGRITSKVMSPMNRCTVALGYVNAMKSTPGTRLVARATNGEGLTAEILKAPPPPR